METSMFVPVFGWIITVVYLIVVVSAVAWAIWTLNRMRRALEEIAAALKARGPAT